MSLTDMKQKIAATVAAYRMAIMSLMLSGLVGMASAADLNASVGPILDSLVLLFVPLLALILGAVFQRGLCAPGRRNRLSSRWQSSGSSSDYLL